MSEARMSPEVIITYCIFSLTLCTTIARLYTRQQLLRQIGADDVLILFASVLGFAMLALHHHLSHDALRISSCLAQDPQSSGHLSSWPPVVDAWKLLFAKSLVYPTQFGFIKLSILAFYSRFALRQPARHVLYVIATSTILFTVAICLATIFSCRPIHASWDDVSTGVCKVNGLRLQLGNSLFNLITDITILLLPVPIIRGLHASERKRVALATIFSIGFMGTAATMVRLSKAVLLIQRTGMDATHRLLGIIDLLFWSELELNIGTICSNLPALAALWKVLRGRTDSRVMGSGSQAYPTAYRCAHGRRPNVMTTSVTGRSHGSSEEYDTPKAYDILRSTKVIVNVEDIEIGRTEEK